MTTLRPLTATASRACHLGFLSMKLILTVRSVWMVMAQLGHSATRRDRRQANRQRLRQFDQALGTRV